MNFFRCLRNTGRIRPYIREITVFDKNLIKTLLNYIFEKDICLGVGDEKENEHTLSITNFTKMIKETLGEEYDFVFGEQEDNITIINTRNKREFGTIYGKLNYGYVRGDDFGTPLKFIYSIFNHRAYIRNKYVGFVCDAYGIQCKRDDRIYVADRESMTFNRYNLYGELKWSTPIPANDIYTYKISYKRMTDEYPANLIALHDDFVVFHFYEDTGRYFGKTSYTWRLISDERASGGGLKVEKGCRLMDVLINNYKKWRQ